MTPSRIEALHAFLERRPDDLRARFGLAIEYLKEGRRQEGIAELRTYLAGADDEGNAWGRLAGALLEEGDEAGARDALERGVEAAERHGHPTMADELRERLEEVG